MHGAPVGEEWESPLFTDARAPITAANAVRSELASSEILVFERSSFACGSREP
jgi:hypothetical protein